MSEAQQPSVPSAPERPVLAGRRAGDRAARAIAVVGILAALTAAVFAWDARQSLRGLESRAGGRLAELGEEAAQSKAALTLAQASLKESQARLSELESRVAEAQEGRVQLEEMYRDLSRNADDRLPRRSRCSRSRSSSRSSRATSAARSSQLQTADQRLAQGGHAGCGAALRRPRRTWTA
jgi:chromosome segregation ATPase